MYIPDNATVFVATTSDAQIVGMVCCHEPKRRRDAVEPSCTLPTCIRGQGIGTALLKSAIAYAGDKTEIALVMNSANRPLRRFYKKFRLYTRPP